MLQDDRTSEYFNDSSAAEERQPLLPSDNLHPPHLSINGLPRNNQQTVAQPWKNLLVPSVSALSLNKEQAGRSNAWKISAAAFSFFVVGINTSASGVLIPYLEPFYHLNDTTVSLIFIAPLLGYLVAASLNSRVHVRLGQQGVAVIAPTCHVIHALVFSMHPPYPVILVAFAINGFGVGLVDSAWCAWAGELPSPNTAQGFLHGSFSLGATFGPVMASILFTKAELPWYTYYYVLAGASSIELALLTYAFWHENGSKYRTEHSLEEHENGLLKEAAKNKVTWSCALYFLTYVGTEASIGGWIVTFMLRVRSAPPSVSSLCASGFWIGMALGRLALGLLTERYGERPSVTVYIALAVALEVLFRLVDSIAVSLVTVTLLGFFLGPLFPSGVVMVAWLLPKHLHVSAIAIAAAVGQVGGASAPFAVGALTQRWGVQVFQIVILALLLLVLSCWLSFPRLKREEVQAQL